MNVTFRNYVHDKDYQLISNFLVAHYQTDNKDGNWLEPAWEYMHGHPYLDASSLGRIGIWEDGGEIVAVVHYESGLGEAFFQIHPAYKHLRVEMLAYAETSLAGIDEANGRRYLNVSVNEDNTEFLSLLRERGYNRIAGGDRPMTKFDIPVLFPSISLPEGFRLTSLAEECDWAKVHRVMWRGFDHGDDVPMNEEEYESRRKMFDTPKARRDLKIAVKASNGDFVSFCGMFHEPINRFAYVEPVATIPDYRRMGLGKAAVLEGIRRCGALGAKVAYVGSDQDFYLALGFREISTSQHWVKYLQA